VFDLGLVYSCEISDEDSGGSLVKVKMTLTAPGCGMGDMIATEVKQKIEGIPGASEAKVELVWDPPWDRDMINESAR
jgi:metal-sulfur cluster biosynthetic enzyme